MDFLASIRSGLFKLGSLVLAILLLAAIWYYDDSGILIDWFDANLRLIKFISAQFPRNWAVKIESGVRFFGADHILVYLEAVALIKLILLGLGRTFRTTGTKETYRD
ncbi:MAG TPA: hypothetical protein VHD38_03070 [Candidatus Paceibacterota bacterium]|jgi:hypothetical protein|nr:hypothetical protein [Candidatus Paceibacterota bacterium]